MLYDACSDVGEGGIYRCFYQDDNPRPTKILQKSMDWFPVQVVLYSLIEAHDRLNFSLWLLMVILLSGLLLVAVRLVMLMCIILPAHSCMC